jgi:two-component system, chemotaxis family, chemotaxis protein CheY
MSEIVLIVEDDAAFSGVVSDLIREEGLAVAAAINGKQALKMPTAGLRPIGILLDMMMPVMDGATFRQAQLALADARTVPVAVMSASGMSRCEVTALFGDVEYIAKPTNGSAILAFITRCRLQQSHAPGGTHSTH